MDFDLAAAGAGCLATAFLAGAFLLAAGRVAINWLRVLAGVD
jgi:hypothetical protein